VSLPHRFARLVAPFVLALGLVPAVALAEPAFPNVAFVDDFKDNNSGWEIYSRRQGAAPFVEGTGPIEYQAGYANAGYFLYVNVPDRTIYSSNYQIQRMGLTDVSVQVTATKGNGPDKSSFGLTCRHSGSNLGDPASYYAMGVGTDGFYGIDKVVNGERTYLTETAFAPDVINGGNTANVLRMDCVGSHISIYANDVLLAEADDDTLTTGGVALWASSPEAEAGTGVVFNSFVLTTP
jgi:hypothetical protein